MGGTGIEVKLLDRLQRIIARLPLGHCHPGIASAETLTLGIDHGELAGALTDPLGLHRFPAEIQATTVQDSFRHRVEIHLSEVVIGTDGREIVVDDALHHEMITVFKRIQMMEDEAVGGFEDARLLTGKTTGVSRYQPETPFPTGLGRQALSRTLFAGYERKGIEGDGVLQEHRPVGGDGEIVEEGETGKAVGAVVQ